MTQFPASNEPISSPQAEYDQLSGVSPEVPCPYLAGRQSRSEAYYADELDGGGYEFLLGRGFRRSGRIVYRPRCRQCHECRQLRIPVNEFTRSRSLRRVWRANADVQVEVGAPTATDEKYALFLRYLDSQHDETMARTRECFVEFLYDSPMDTSEIRYHLGERLVGVSLVDRCPGGLSSVYMYFDPDFGTRSLGTFSVLWEVDYCRREDHPFYYLGYYVAGCATMEYKARFRPNQVLVGDDRWGSFRA